MKIQKDIILPKVPSDASPEMQQFCQDIIKSINSLNIAIHNEFKNFTVPQKRTGGTRDATSVKPDNPSVGTIYFEDDDNTLGVCVGHDTNDEPIWMYASLK
mgnify:CR=1 FL=1